MSITRTSRRPTVVLGHGGAARRPNGRVDIERMGLAG